MAMKELCRLCASKDEFSKDLLDESNKSVLKMIQDILQIFVIENDTLPTKLCTNCEERLVSFQLFMMECYKIQDTLKKVYADELGDLQIKHEQEQATNLENAAVIKFEVKDEMTTEDIVSALNDQDNILDEDMHLYDNNSHPNEAAADDYDFLDNVAIATLKQIKNKQLKTIIASRTDKEKLNKVLKSPHFKVKDIVSFDCVLCTAKMKNWTTSREHYEENHKVEPVAICLCGYKIRSKTIMYKHYALHKRKSKKINNIVDSENEEVDQDQIDDKYAHMNVRDFVRFICQACAKECSSWYSLTSHCQEKHDIVPVVQCICGITLKSKSVMYKHVQDHKNPNFVACDKCPRITKTISAMNKHKMRHVPKSERQYTCESCGKIFTTKDSLKSHERSHIPIEDRKIYHCEVCNLKFTTRSSVASHKRVVHDKIKSYVCDLCGYACGTGGELRQHRAIHSDDKPFVCRKCNKPFKTYSNLKTHMDTHADTSYECYICQRLLNSRRTLRKHLLVHEEKCRHVCSYCNKAFKRRQTLKVHMYTHTGDKPLTCKWCDERFAYASTLRSHRLRCHPDKMAPQAHAQPVNTAQRLITYQAYGEHVNMQENYIKNDAAVPVAVSVSVAKNELEAM